MAGNKRSGDVKHTPRYRIGKLIPQGIKYLEGIMDGGVESPNASKIGLCKWLAELALKGDGDKGVGYEELLKKIGKEGSGAINEERKKDTP